MNIINQSVELWKQEDGIEGMYKHIEKAARICYKSENKGNVTAEQFVKKLIQARHFRCLEFGTLCFSYGTFPDWNEKVESPWFKDCDGWLVTNLRWLVEHAPFNWEMYVMISQQQGGLNANLTNYYRPTFHWSVSRVTADSFRTHVTLSSLMESTRYCNYGKKGMAFVAPYWYDNNKVADYRNGSLNKVPAEEYLYKQWEKAEENYNALLNHGLQPQQAREVLPLSVATNLVQCGFKEMWENFFRQRTDKAAHPDAHLIATGAKGLYDTMLFNHIQSN